MIFMARFDVETNEEGRVSRAMLTRSMRVHDEALKLTAFVDEHLGQRNPTRSPS